MRLPRPTVVCSLVASFTGTASTFRKKVEKSCKNSFQHMLNREFHQVSINVRIRLLGVGSADRRRFDFVMYGATPLGEALCCDVTLV